MSTFLPKPDFHQLSFPEGKVWYRNREGNTQYVVFFWREIGSKMRGQGRKAGTINIQFSSQPNDETIFEIYKSTCTKVAIHNHTSIQHPIRCKLSPPILLVMARR